MVYHTNKLYVIIIFFEFIHFGCYFTPLLYYSDKIVRPQIFTLTVDPSTQPSPFHVTIRCDASYILQAATFLSTFYV